MTIEKNTVVSLNYTLFTRKGISQEEKMIENTLNSGPFVFLFGSGGLIAGFESNLRGKKTGDAFDFYVQPAQGYGEILQEWVIEIPIESFRNAKGELDPGILQIGNTVPMSDDKGNRLQGIVKNISEKNVKMDFNHPLAGQELHFTGTVLHIRMATPDELSHGHVHGPGGHNH